MELVDPRYSTSTCLEVFIVIYLLAILWVSMSINSQTDIPPGEMVLIYVALVASPLALVGFLALVTVWLRACRIPTLLDLSGGA